MPQYSDVRRIVAELIGTAFLLATVIGSGIMASGLSSGNDALALLGNTIATGAILVVLVTMFGPISGAHFNPAVTLVFWCRGEIPLLLALSFILAQVIGGFVGVLAAHAMFDMPMLQLSEKIRNGPAQWFAEWVATFGLVVTILVTLKSRPDAVPMSVGLYISSAYWFTASTSFANPAVTLARAFSNTFAGIRLADVAPFIVAQLIGAAGAMLICRWLLEHQQPD